MTGPPSSVSSHLEELHANAGKHELQECGHDHDIPNGPDGHEHTLYHVLQAPTNMANGHCRPQWPWGRDSGHGWSSWIWAGDMWSWVTDVWSGTCGHGEVMWAGDVWAPTKNKCLSGMDMWPCFRGLDQRDVAVGKECMVTCKGLGLGHMASGQGCVVTR